MQRFSVGELHLALTPEPIWYGTEETEISERETTAEFTKIGVLTNQGLDRDFIDTLTALSRPSLAFYGWIHSYGTQRAIFTGALGREAILAVREDPWIALRQIQPNNLAPELVAELPKMAPLNSPRYYCPVADLVSEFSGGTRNKGSVMQTVSNTRDARQAQMIKKLMQIPQTGSGELYAEVRYKLGRTIKAPHPLGYVDTESGRLLNVIEQKRGSEPYAIVAPAAPADLVQHLHQMHARLTSMSSSD